MHKVCHFYHGDVRKGTLMDHGFMFHQMFVGKITMAH